MRRWLLVLLVLTVGGLFWLAQSSGRPPADTQSGVEALAGTPSAVSSPAVPNANPTSTSTSALPTASPTSDLPLAGRRIGLDPGHGPRRDLGAVLVDKETGKLILSEAEFNLDVALRCRDILVARGAEVMLTRETDDTFTAPWPADVNGDGDLGDEADDLQARIDMLNDFDAEVFLSIHANAGSARKADRHEIQVIYCGTPDCPNPDENRELGKYVLDELVDKLAQVDYEVDGSELVTDLEVDSSDPPLHLFVLGPANGPRHVRAVSMPGVLSESLYVSSPAQAALLKLDRIRDAIALAYADALQDFLTSDR